VRSYGEESSEQTTRVTRSIMIVKPPGYESGSPLASPAGSTTPVSPFSGKVVIIHLYIYSCFVTVKLKCLQESKVKYGVPKFRACYILSFCGMA